MTEFGASSSSSTSQSCMHDVFLSFRGPDTRNGFTGHLYRNLVRSGIKVFIDDGLERGEKISSGLLRAIEESKISVIVFSKNYASSRWCLDELVKILQCKESKQQMVYPVFYKVDPSHVRHQTGSFYEAFVEHESRFKNEMENVARWKLALTEAANLSGQHVSDEGYEAGFIDMIVGDISAKLLTRTHLKVAKYPVGIESRVKDMLKLLRLGENAVCMVGIWGIGGIGKTTVAKAVYNSIADKFEGSCFLENVKEAHGDLVQLQNLILYETLGVKELNMNKVDLGVNVIKTRLSNKRVLIVVDDVNDLEQLSYLVGNTDWFGSGSRIIITTRDKRLLTAHDIDQVYQVKQLDDCEALELFKLSAIKGKTRVDDYNELMKNVILYAQGVPLVLEILGSDLRGKHVEQWKVALDSYAKEPNQQIQKKLKLSYDAQQESVKEVFLHIACFFKGQKKKYVIDILEGCDLNPERGIEVLTEKALITVTEEDIIQMHDLLEEMGKEIVRQESPNEPGERSRLWRYEDIYRVFVENTGTNKIKGIMVKEGRSQQIPLTGKSFSKLKNLQILMISKDVFNGDYVNSLSNELKLLYWEDCPLKSFPSDFNPTKVVVLDMPCSRTSPLGEVQKILFGVKMPWSCSTSLKMGQQKLFGVKMPWSSTGQTEIIPNLKSINLSWCRCLRKMCGLSMFPNLVDLSLQGCENLVEFDPSIGYLKNLVNLDLSFCIRLEKFEIVGEMPSLKSLNLRQSGIRKLLAFGNLINLEQFSLAGCRKLEEMPGIIFELRHLRHLNLEDCPKLVRLPTPVPPGVSGTSTYIYDSSQSLFIDLKNCRGLEEILDIRPTIDHLNLSGCTNLQRISEGNRIFTLNLSGCEMLCNNSELKALLFSPANHESEIIFPRSSGGPYFGETILEGHNFSLEMRRYNELSLDKGLNSGLAFLVEWKMSAIGSFRVYVNGQCIGERFFFYPSLTEDHVWLYYVPFTIIELRLGYRLRNIFKVRFDFNYGNDVVKSCGVQVLLPNDEEFNLVKVHQIC